MLPTLRRPFATKSKVCKHGTTPPVSFPNLSPFDDNIPYSHGVLFDRLVPMALIVILQTEMSLCWCTLSGPSHGCRRRRTVLHDGRWDPDQRRAFRRDRADLGYEAHPDARVLGDGSAAVLPGLINAHHHSNAINHIQHGIEDDVLEPWILET